LKGISVHGWPSSHFGIPDAVGIEFAVLPRREVDFVHDLSIEHDGDSGSLSGEGHADRFSGGYDGALGAGWWPQKAPQGHVEGFSCLAMGRKTDPAAEVVKVLTAMRVAIDELK
jgi:hypothetical protein